MAPIMNERNQIYIFFHDYSNYTHRNENAICFLLILIFNFISKLLILYVIEDSN